MMYTQYVIKVTQDVGIIPCIVMGSSFSFIPQTGVGFARSVTHLVHEYGKMGAKHCISTLQALQSMYDGGTFAGLWSKFWA